MPKAVASANRSATVPFRTSQSLQTKRHSVNSVTKNLDGAANVNEARYWTHKLGLGDSKYGSTIRKFAHPRRLKLRTKGSSLVQQVAFGPPALSKSTPLAVVSGPRVGLYGTNPHSEFSRAVSRHSLESTRNKGVSVSPERQIQVGGHVATCAAFRRDGRLMAVGTDAGELRICDVTMRATLATFTTASKLPTRCVSWLRSGQTVFTGSDDGVGRLWNTGSTDKTKPQLALTGHGDAIRCAAIRQEPVKMTGDAKWWNEVAFTGSYDHTIRMWDIDTEDSDSPTSDSRCLAVLNHDAPVEAVLLLKSESTDVPFWLLSAGGTSVKVWNPVSSVCVHTVQTQHRKTITSLISVIRKDLGTSGKRADTYLRIVTSALDGTMQFHSWNAVSGRPGHLYTTKVGGAITAMAMDETGDKVAIGTANGSVMVNVRGPPVSTKRKREPAAGTYSYFQRGMNADPNGEDFVVAARDKKPKLSSHDKAIREFRYGDALDIALGTRRARDVISVLEELGRRQGLNKALSNRDEESLEPILSFVTRYVNKSHFAPILIGVANKLLDIYSNIRGQSETIDELFVKLKNHVSSEINSQKGVLRLIGQIESAMNNVDYE